MKSILAEIFLIAGKREAGVQSGYRPNLFIGGYSEDNNTDCVINLLPDVELIPDGNTVLANITLVHPELLKMDKLKGMTFCIQEGRKVVGQGMFLTEAQDKK